MAEAKLPPHDLPAEAALLGSLLLNGEGMFSISPMLREEDFFQRQNGWVFKACLNLFQRQEAIDQVTVAHELSRSEKLEAVGGSAYLMELVAQAPTPFEAEPYAAIVRRLSRMRQLIDAAGEIARLGYQGGPDADSVLDQAEDILYRLHRGEGLRDFIPLRQLLDQYFEEPAPSPGGRAALPHTFTGFAALDEWLGGLQRSDLIILAARPSLGKTSLALGIARHAALQYNACVGIFSLEMAREAVVERFLAAESGVDTRRLRLKLYTEEEEHRLMDASGVLAEANIYIDDAPQPRVVELRSRARRLHHERGLDLLIVDYLQLIQGEGRGDNRVQEISYISRSLKALARELDVPVLTVSQLSRASEWRASHRPQLSDLRESGSIEQDADIVLFIYRDEVYYTPEEWAREFGEKEYPRGIADIIIGKHRNGPTGEVQLRWVPRTAKFENLAAERASDVSLPGFSR